jgi:stage V sporulation protein G
MDTTKGRTMITDVKIYPFNGQKTKAFVSIKYHDIVLTGMKIVEGQNGPFVAMPSQKAKEDYRDIYFPVTKEARQAINDAVLAQYGGVSQEPQGYGDPGPERGQFSPEEDSMPF